jgi:anaerobic magnesium-protoporphyrin IX monomethyl ester cyclase
MIKNFRVLLFYPNITQLGATPSNLAILSAYLKQDGFDVKLFDCTIYKPRNEETDDDIRTKLGQVKKSKLDDYFITKDTAQIYDDFIQLVEEYRPNLIGFSLVDSTVTSSLSFIKRIKHKNIPIIIGGVASTFSYEKILNTGLVDYACIGEGEEALVELCNKMMNGEDCSKIRNIYTIDKKGNIIKNPLRPLVDVNSMPTPDFSIYEDYRFYKPFFGNVVRTLRIDTDRGCPMVCTYCAAPLLRQISRENECGSYFRVKDVDKIIEETKELVKRHNISFIFMGAESFLSMPVKKLRYFAERYKNEVNIPFTCQVRIDTFTEEKTRLLAEMGCKSASVGLEHGSEKIRQELLNKRLTNKQVIDGFIELSKYDIVPGVNNMIGLPDETRENVFESIEMNRIIYNILKGKMTLNVFTFMPFSGTKLRQLCLDKGYIKGDEDLPLSWYNRSVLNMPSLSQDEIAGLEKTFVLYVKLPKSNWSDIKIAEKDDVEGNAMFEKLSALIKI